MPSFRLRSLSTALALILFALPLTGCLVLDSGTGTSAVIIDKLRISVLSGTHPIAGATIQLYEADLTSYTGTSAARLPNPVITGKDGTYTASTVLVCNPHSLFYLVATGGNAGAGDDPSIALITAVGSCDSLATPKIVLNEATTVASAYALSGFMSSLTSVSANATVGTNNGTRLALTGITNAFATVHNLVNIHTGVALATTPAGNGTVPQARINSLANLLAACIESTGFGSTPCTGLAANAPSLTGVAPANTLQAILNIAHNPGANIAAIAALLPAAPYTPALTAIPNDLTLSITYKGTGTGSYQALAADNDGHIWAAFNNATNTGSLVEFDPRGSIASTFSGSAAGITSPVAIAIDPRNNIWVQNCSGTCSLPYGTAPGIVSYNLVKIGNGGSPVNLYPQGSTFFTPLPQQLVSDGQGNIYAYDATSSGQPGIVEYAADGTLASGHFPLIVPPPFSARNATGLIALNGQEDVSVLLNVPTIVFYDPSGTPIRTVLPPQFNGGTNTFTSTAFDHSGNLFIVGNEFISGAGQTLSILSVLTPSTTTVPVTSYFNYPGGLDIPNAIIVDGAGTQWIANSSRTNLSAFTSAGTPLSPTSLPPAPPFFFPPTSGGFQAGFTNSSPTIAIDTAGNVWIADQATPTLAEYVGAATPVTPLAIGVRDNTVGQRP